AGPGRGLSTPCRAPSRVVAGGCPSALLLLLLGLVVLRGRAFCGAAAVDDDAAQVVAYPKRRGHGTAERCAAARVPRRRGPQVLTKTLAERAGRVRDAQRRALARGRKRVSLAGCIVQDGRERRLRGLRPHGRRVKGALADGEPSRRDQPLV